MELNYNVSPARKFLRAFLSVFILLFSLVAFSQTEIGEQAESVRTGVTFQWFDDQDINNNGDIDDNENNRSATIESITVDSNVFNTFVVPSGYQLTRLGGNGNLDARNNRNGIFLNRTNPPFSGEVVGTSITATLDITDNNAWDDAALEAFQSANLNHYFTSNGNGDNICLLYTSPSPRD